MRFADPTRLLAAWLSPNAKNVHGRSPAYENRGYGSPSEPTRASPPKKIVKITIVRSGWRTAHAAPRTVCLYRTFTSRQTRKNRSWRNSHTSPSRSDIQPRVGRITVHAASVASRVVLMAAFCATGSTLCRPKDSAPVMCLRHCETLRQLHSRHPPQRSPDTRPIGQRMRDGAGARSDMIGREPRPGGLANELCEFVDRGASAAGYVVCPTARRFGRLGGGQVRGHGIRNVRKVTRLLAITVNDRPFPSEAGPEEARDDGRGGAGGVLTRTVDVEVSKAHELHPETPSEYAGELLVHGFRRRVRGEGLSLLAFSFRECRTVAVDAR